MLGVLTTRICRFINYVTKKHCITPISPAEYDDQEPQLKLKKPILTPEQLVYRALNLRGLMGLAEFILESKLFISTVLKAVTIHLEQNENGQVLIHCNAGKDRTGIVIMLCESMLGVKDDDIIADFAKSKCIRGLAETRFTKIFKGRVDAAIFSGAPPQAMMLTLEYLRHKYGSITDYLDTISFDDSWQRRFAFVAS